MVIADSYNKGLLPLVAGKTQGENELTADERG